MEPEAATTIRRTPTMNSGLRRASSATADAGQAARTALRRLLESSSAPEERKDLLAQLGNGRSDKGRKKTQRETTVLHESLAMAFNKHGKATDSDTDILEELVNGQDEESGQPYRLQNLLAKGSDNQSILHTILDPSTYTDPFNFDRVKPLIRFLLWLHPELPDVPDDKGKTPLFAVLSWAETNTDGQESVLDKDSKRRIVHYLCHESSKDNPNGLGSQFAIESLSMVSSGGGEGIAKNHAIHLAIENDVSISEKAVRQLSGLWAKTDRGMDKVMCLEMLDCKGRSCLHLALTSPFSLSKISWAETLARLQPQLLKSTYTTREGDKKASLTPLQHFTEQRGKDRQERKSTRHGSKEADLVNSRLDSLEDFLKQQCLGAFDDATCKNIMYTRNNVREIYLAFEENDSVSWESLTRQSQHYKLDTTLKTLQIPKVKIIWDTGSAAAKKQVTSWNCFGSTDLYLIFHWLKTRDPLPGKKNFDSLPVKKIFEVVVDDFGDEETKPHSDKAIVESLRGLQIETWNWRRMDIPTEVIYKSAGEHVKTLHLYCSGSKVVLEAWADTKGLARLKNLERVYLEPHQGLESIETMKEYVMKFKEDLEKTFEEVNKRKLLEVRSEPIKHALGRPGAESAASKLKDETEQGFEEQDWLKCMDQFADVMELLDAGGTAPVKVALIDDGVKSSYAGLDDCIERGRSWTQPPKPNQSRLVRRHSQNYNTSQVGHGTVMAYFICRVCPKVRLYVAKLDPETERADSSSHSSISFSIESAAEAIEWAVAEKVDIISMSWAIDKRADEHTTKRAGKLRDAIKLAADNNILLFCANPDKGPGSKNESYPKQLDTDRVFCIGAATQESTRWSQIDANDTSCDYFLPGVELGFQVETGGTRQRDKPPGIWKTYNGSSLSCALAAGLAAMMLHCAQVAGRSDRDYTWLKSHDGMANAFNSLHVTRNNWLPVRRVFKEILQPTLPMEAKAEALKDIVSRFFYNMPHGPVNMAYESRVPAYRA